MRFFLIAFFSTSDVRVAKWDIIFDISDLMADSSGVCDGEGGRGLDGVSWCVWVSCFGCCCCWGCNWFCCCCCSMISSGVSGRVGRDKGISSADKEPGWSPEKGGVEISCCFGCWVGTSCS